MISVSLEFSALCDAQRKSAEACSLHSKDFEVRIDGVRSGSTEWWFSLLVWLDWKVIEVLLGSLR
jgi:hypothetical protein